MNINKMGELALLKGIAGDPENEDADLAGWAIAWLETLQKEIDQAVHTYDEWMLDDDYEPMNVLRQIIDRLRKHSDPTL